jgi:hypothetical protein
VTATLTGAAVQHAEQFRHTARMLRRVTGQQTSERSLTPMDLALALAKAVQTAEAAQTLVERYWHRMSGPKALAAPPADLNMRPDYLDPEPINRDPAVMYLLTAKQDLARASAATGQTRHSWEWVVRSFPILADQGNFPGSAVRIHHARLHTLISDLGEVIADTGVLLTLVEHCDVLRNLHAGIRDLGKAVEDLKDPIGKHAAHYKRDRSVPPRMRQQLAIAARRAARLLDVAEKAFADAAYALDTVRRGIDRGL